jgi:hypothetical protein
MLPIAILGRMNQPIQPPLYIQRALLPMKAVQVLSLDEQNHETRTASGFIRREGKGLFLYTCWHVVTRVDPITLKPPPPPWNRPVTLRVRLQAAKSPSPGTIMIGGLCEIDISLYQSDSITPLWAQDKEEIPSADLNRAGLRAPFWHDAVKIRLPDELVVGDPQLIDGLSPYIPQILGPGDKLLVVGYPYGYSAFGSQQPTPIVLTRFLAAGGTGTRLRTILLDAGGAEGMSGGPVFLERDSALHLIGLYTGVVYPDQRGNPVTALGTCCDLSLCWAAHADAGLVIHPPTPSAARP